MSDIVIPSELLPTDGRFGSGPSKVRKEQTDALAQVWRSYMGTSHRQAAVRNEVQRLRRMRCSAIRHRPGCSWNAGAPIPWRGRS